MQEIRKVTIIGAGTMGHSIALNFAWKGFPVTMVGQDAIDLERGLAGIRSKLAVMVDEQLVNSHNQDLILQRITTLLDIKQAATEADIVIEAVPEVLEMKQQLFQQLEQLCLPETILASNTSGLAPSLIADALNTPERFVVMHFWNPAHLIPLVEIVPARFTTLTTIDAACSILKALNKRAILVKKEIPGFISNRLQFALLREAQYLLEMGVATQEDIDAAVTHSIGRRLPVTGPFLSADMGGLDLFDKISNYLYPELSTAQESSVAMKALVSEGKFGLKTGEGFYKWNEEMTVMGKRREQMLIRFLKMDAEG